jgi:hypothetical protein|tara:strand:- start:717 stop:983 length:267 start_codon:yes stop_codon:yes gene_type:complete
MEKLLLIAAVITFLFTIFKVVEMKYIAKKWTPLKYVIRDASMVFGASFLGLFGFFQINGTLNDFMNVVTDGKALNLKATQIFTDEPGF